MRICQFPFVFFGFIALLLISPLTSAQQLPNGGVLAGEISVPDEVDQFQFTGVAGEVVLIRVADSAGDGSEDVSAFDPFVALAGPDGDTLATGSSGITGGLVAAIAIRLVTDGQYTVSVLDDGAFDGANIGPYNIHFAKVPGASDGGRLLNGDEIDGRIDLGDIDSFVFDGIAGETVFVRVADTETTEFVNSSFSPTVILYGPDGDLIASENSSIRGGLVARISARLVEDGEYTIVVIDGSGTGNDSLGDYTLHFAKPPGSGNAVGQQLAPDDVITSDIELGDIDLFRFSAFAGETVYLRAADNETTELVDSSFTPFLALYDPTGDLVASDGTATTGGLVASLASQLSEDGMYTLVLLDSSGSGANVGTYSLHYAKAPGSNEGGGISDGQVLTGEIELGDLDAFVFSAQAGTEVGITMTEVVSESSLTPGITVLGPTGDPIITNAGSVSAFVSFVAQENGVFTIIARDLRSFGENVGVGEYTLSLVGEGVVGSVVECNGLSVTVDLNLGETPGPGDDVVLGTSGADFIDAGAGDDTICAMGGADTILAGGGADYVEGGNGADLIFGEGGNDIIFGGPSGDEIDGGGGDDEIFGEDGDDTLVGRTGEDLLDGGPGVDSISGGPQADTIFTGPGATVGTGSFVSGGGSADDIFGGPDADDLRGAAGADTIRGEGGDDVITGGIGQDDLFGGDGDDTIRGQGSRDDLFGEGGDDDLFGGAGDDDLDGGSGIDSCAGQAGTGDTAVNCESESTIP